MKTKEKKKKIDEEAPINITAAESAHTYIYPTIITMGDPVKVTFIALIASLNIHGACVFVCLDVDYIMECLVLKFADDGKC